MVEVAHALKSLKTKHKRYPLAALPSQMQCDANGIKETTVKLRERRHATHTRFTPRLHRPTLHEVVTRNHCGHAPNYRGSFYMGSRTHSHMFGRSDSLSGPEIFKGRIHTSVWSDATPGPTRGVGSVLYGDVAERHVGCTVTKLQLQSRLKSHICKSPKSCNDPGTVTRLRRALRSRPRSARTRTRTLRHAGAESEGFDRKKTARQIRTAQFFSRRALPIDAASSPRASVLGCFLRSRTSVVMCNTSWSDRVCAHAVQRG